MHTLTHACSPLVIETKTARYTVYTVDPAYRFAFEFGYIPRRCTQILLDTAHRRRNMSTATFKSYLKNINEAILGDRVRPVWSWFTHIETVGILLPSVSYETDETYVLASLPQNRHRKR
jgi:hypothetical protein